MSQAHPIQDHGHGHHDPHLAHHFDTMNQQVASGKLGMWVFLGTEILMFGGLFCAYSIWRANHYDAFAAGFQYLDTMMGAINTVILIASSFTMAWAVRTAQLGKNKATAILLGLTLLGGFGFMGIKYLEYSHKYHLGVFVGPFGKWDEFHAKVAAEDALLLAARQQALTPPTGIVQPGAAPTGLDVTEPGVYHEVKDSEEQLEGHAAPGTLELMTGGVMAQPRHAEVSKVVPEIQHDPAAAAHGDDHGGHETANPREALHARTFFSIYFLMTGLHGIHVVIGMGLIAWILVRALRHEFGPTYNAPVDLVGLYWHLVDLIWIFLFPLLYLIK